MAYLLKEASFGIYSKMRILSNDVILSLTVSLITIDMLIDSLLGIQIDSNVDPLLTRNKP